MLVSLVVASQASPVALVHRLSILPAVAPIREVTSLVDRVKPLHTVVATSSKAQEMAVTSDPLPLVLADQLRPTTAATMVDL